MPTDHAPRHIICSIPLPPAMAVATKKRSLYDMQDLRVFPNEANRHYQLEESYKMMVLRFENGLSEEDVDKHFLRMALNLGINVPQDPKTTLDIVTSNVDGLTLASAPTESRPPPSQSFQSTHPPSDSSSEQQYHTKASSVTTASIASVASSFDSATSHRSSYRLIKRGIRRLSTLQRRRTIDEPIPSLLSYMSSTSVLRPPSQASSVTADPGQTTLLPQESVAIPSSSVSPARGPPPPPGPDEQDQENIAARERSLHNLRLQRLRTSQLGEQSRFIRFEADQYRLMRLKQVEIKQDPLNRHKAREKAAQDRHIEALSSLEHRHLSAEVDLCRALQLEKQACETRLRHMEAYCNPTSKVDGMPNRVVTRKDYQQLTLQYHVRHGMDNLHAARINVLREKQGKQLERVSAKQDHELETFAADFERETANLEQKYKAEEEGLQAEFSERQKRLVARWLLAEAIERRKLENETRETFGPLPAVEWPDSASRSEESEEETLERFAHDAVMAYDAATLGMI
jgi:hypothetical protein